MTVSVQATEYFSTFTSWIGVKCAYCIAYEVSKCMVHGAKFTMNNHGLLCYLYFAHYLSVQKRSKVNKDIYVIHS